ncbi:TetR/AcrR family transcriptional regulator [Clavibacter zhangzhiyongii]|uniref:TetR/AcrR family transcriptional regulator n=1 Tax=Clavibacter zhangzhiyongii TaxID=2768071 RepID=UPI0039E0B037
MLYHFASKEALLDALLEPTIDALAEVIDRADSIRGDADARRLFVERFIDFLLLHRHEVALFITQGRSLGHLAVIERANDLVRTLGETAGALDSTLDQLRFGVALGGAAYILAASDDWSTNEPLPDDEIRAALVVVVGSSSPPRLPHRLIPAPAIPHARRATRPWPRFCTGSAGPRSCTRGASSPRGSSSSASCSAAASRSAARPRSRSLSRARSRRRRSTASPPCSRRPRVPARRS